MVVVRSRFTEPPLGGPTFRGSGAGQTFGFGRVRQGLGATADQVGEQLYPKYTGEWVYEYQDMFPSLDIGSLPPHGTFADLVSQGVLTRDEVIQGFNVDPTFAAQNPSNIDNGIMRTNYDVIVPVDQAQFNALQNNIIASVQASNAAQAAGTGPVVKLVNGQNVDGNGNPYPPGDPHYYNQLADMIDQYLASGGTRGVATVAMQSLVKSNPALVDTLPPDLLTTYAEVFDNVLNPPPPAASAPPASGASSSGGGSSSSTSGSSAGSTGTAGDGSSTGVATTPGVIGSGATGDMPQPTPPTPVPTTGTSLLSAGMPGGVWGWVALAGLGLAVVASKRKR